MNYYWTVTLKTLLNRACWVLLGAILMALFTTIEVIDNTQSQVETMVLPDGTTREIKQERQGWSWTGRYEAPDFNIFEPQE